jgi:hypothetical protein
VLTTVKDVAWRTGCVLATLACAPAAAQGVFSLQFQGPESLAGEEGTVVRGKYGVMLRKFGTGPGAQAWSVGMTSSGSTVVGATTAGTAADVVEMGGLRQGGFEKTETIDPARNDGRTGAVSAVVLSFTEPVRLVNSVSAIASIDVDFTLPPGSGSATLSFEDGLRGSGLPVKLAVTQEGQTKVPMLASRVVELTGAPPSSDCCARPVNIGFSTRVLRGRPPFEGVEGVGPSCHARDGVIGHAVPGGPLKVFLNVVSDLDGKSGGVEGWSFSVTLDGGGDMLSATTAGTAADRKENGGLWFGGFTKTEVTDPARNDGHKGAIVACVLSLTERTTLPLRGTESVLALEVSGPEGMTSLLSVGRYALRGGQPVQSVLTVGGESRLPCNLKEASLRIRHLPSQLFIRGDGNGDLGLDIADPVWLVASIYHDGPPAPCPDAADSNDDGLVDASDVVYLIEYLFRAGDAPSSPFPECGLDVTEDDVDCQAGSPVC